MNEPVQGQPISSAAASSAVIADSRAAPNLIGALLAGAVAAVVGAVLWAVVTVMMKAQIGFMAIGVGLLVAFAVRKVGRGSAVTYGGIGAVFALLGCLFGNLLSGCAFVALQENLPIADVTLKMLASPSTSLLLLEETFDGMDLLFYAIAAYEGFKFARVPSAPA
jgi:hypothetical protein